LIAKHSYVRSKKLLKLVASLDCQACGSGNLVAALCLGCHYEIDQGKDLSREKRQEMWLNAHHKTIDALRDCWPIDIPLPNAKI
jgi:hypothetical protein